ncbi:MAG: peptidoglycan-binding protein LysM [Flavobacteriales bacterium]|nr:peptidoglycan-binding protein LysM [Flavobacteriales bacterium]
MGFISFIKNAGKKLFGKKDKETSSSSASPAQEKDRTDILREEVGKYNLPIQNLDLDVSELVTVSGKTNTNAEREKVILAVGNIEGVGGVEDNISVTNPEPEAKFHVVQKGDTLSKIAKDVYGDPMRYPEIFEANRPLLKDPDEIYPGQTLRIPMS